MVTIQQSPPEFGLVLTDRDLLADALDLSLVTSPTTR